MIGLALWWSTAAYATPEDGSMAVIQVETTQPGFTLAAQALDGQAFGLEADGSLITSLDLCVAPCTTTLTPILLELYAHGDGKLATPKRVQLHPGLNRVALEPGRAARFHTGNYIGGIGLGAVLAGTLILVSDPGGRFVPRGVTFGLLGAGVAGGGTGLALRISNAGRWTITQHGSP